MLNNTVFFFFFFLFFVCLFVCFSDISATPDPRERPITRFQILALVCSESIVWFSRGQEYGQPQHQTCYSTIFDFFFYLLDSLQTID